MNNKFTSLIKKSSWILIIAFCLRCGFSWKTLINNVSMYIIFGYAGEAISITTLFILAYEKYLWRFNPLESTPVLYKSYTGYFISNYDNIKRDCKLSVKQTLLSTKIIFLSSESKSKSISSSIDVVLGENILTYCYINTPEAQFRDRSEIHYGTAMLCVDDTKEICGEYFTDRKTIGDMRFKAIQ